jgi:hypothetical protein
MENYFERHCTGDAIRRSLHDRKLYAGQRALLAIDRASHAPVQEQRDNAFRWMRVWMAYAASRHPAFVTRALKAA